MPLDLAAAVRAWRAVGEPGGPPRAAEPWRDDRRAAGCAGLGSAGLGTAGLGTAGLGTAGLGTARLGIGLRTAGTARLRAAAACRMPATRGAVTGRIAGRGTACPGRGKLLARRGHAQAEWGRHTRVFARPRRSGSAGTRAGG